MNIKDSKDFLLKKAIEDAYAQCSSRHFREISTFHPNGKNMPNGIYLQRGGFIGECIANKQAFILDESVHSEQFGLSKYRGGVIIFSSDANVCSDFKDFERTERIFNNLWKVLRVRVFADKKLDKIRMLFNNYSEVSTCAYSIGHSFRGKFQGDGKLYNENSLTFEVNGLSSKSLLKLAELVAQCFGQGTVLVKDLNKNRIYLANSLPKNKDLESALFEINAECN